jgi:hypothetical protein
MNETHDTIRWRFIEYDRRHSCFEDISHLVHQIRLVLQHEHD